MDGRDDAVLAKVGPAEAGRAARTTLGGGGWRVSGCGTRVRAVTMAEAVAITECRMALEGLCAAKAAGRVTGPQAERLLQLGAQLEQARRGRGNRPVIMKGRRTRVRPSPLPRHLTI